MRAGTDDVKLGVKHVEGRRTRVESFWMKERIREWAERQNVMGDEVSV